MEGRGGEGVTVTEAESISPNHSRRNKNRLQVFNDNES
jgi:hypothetical protein